MFCISHAVTGLLVHLILRTTVFYSTEELQLSGLKVVVYLGLAVNCSLELCLLLSYWHVVMLFQSTCSFRCLFWKDTWKDRSLWG